MTREDAISWLTKLYERSDITDEFGDMEDMQPYEESLDMAIKALEQEPILDKIRAEIEYLVFDCGDDYHLGYNLGLMRAAQIIDKYKAESEVEE